MTWLEDMGLAEDFARALTTRELMEACCARYYADGAFRAAYERVAYGHLTGVKGAWDRFWLRRGALFIGKRRSYAAAAPVSDEALLGELQRRRDENAKAKEARDG